MRRLSFLLGLLPVTLWALGAVAQAPTADTVSPAGGHDFEYRDESIYIVQRRAYSKSADFEITPFTYTALNPKFVGYWGLGLSAAYHLEENIAIELTSSLLQQEFYSDLVVEVFHYEDLTPQEVDLKHMTYFGAASLQFSALYGKLEFYGLLFDYDFYVTAGLGVATTLEPCHPKDADCSDPVGANEENKAGDTGRGLRTPSGTWDKLKLTANLGGGMRLFFSDLLGLRVEVRDIAFSDRAVESGAEGATGEPQTDIRNVLMLFAGVSVLL